MKLIPVHIRLLEEQYEWLRKYCYENRISQAEVVREALELYRKEKEKEAETMAGIYEVDGTSYEFEVWESVKGAAVLVAFYEEGGETFGIWTAEVADLPTSPAEAEDFILNLDWAVEDMTSLRREGFRPL